MAEKLSSHSIAEKLSSTSRSPAWQQNSASPGSSKRGRNRIYESQQHPDEQDLRRLEQGHLEEKYYQGHTQERNHRQSGRRRRRESGLEREYGNRNLNHRDSFASQRKRRNKRRRHERKHRLESSGRERQPQQLPPPREIHGEHDHAQNQGPAAGIVSDEDEDVDSVDPQPRNQQQQRQPRHRHHHSRGQQQSGGHRRSTEKREAGPPAITGRNRSPSSHDDTVGHFQGGPGTIIAGRYRLAHQVGLGTFGKVVECLDLHSQRRGRDPGGVYVAIKIVRSVRRYCESAKIEASIIQQINRRGGRGLTHCVVLHDAFDFSGHFCLVFERLGPSLYDFMKRHDYRPFPMVCIQDFAVQLLETMEFLHSFGLVHTDLKIENILLTSSRETTFRNQRVPESTRIKLIDFGGACYNDSRKSSVINTRQYRAPEVILEAGWSMPSDMWSLGCILAELYKGELLFPTHENVEHLALIEKVIGPFPRRTLQRATKYRDVFDEQGRHLLGRVMSGESFAFVKNSPGLPGIVRNPDDDWFLRLLCNILCIDPEDRMTAHESLLFLNRVRRDVVRCVW